MRRILSIFLLFLNSILISHAQIGSAAFTSAMDKAVEAHFKTDAPGGVVLVAQGGKVIYQRALGLADVGRSTPLSTESVFRIGSVTKQFTAVAILQLADAGKLDLQDEIQKYIAFPKKDHPITIEELLTHTSGIPNYTDLPGFTPETFGKDATVAQLIATFDSLPLDFAPGTKWNYSNSGYILLGAIIEKVSGMSWEAYLTEHLFKPAGMTHTSASANNGQLPGEALGYAKTADGWGRATPLSMTWPYAAGSIRSTVGDLFKWNKAVRAGKLLPEKWVREAQTDHHLSDGKATQYGYGWEFGDVQGSPTIEHGGGINGFVSASLYLPKEDIHVVVLTNRESSDAAALAPTLAAIAIGKPYGGPKVPLDSAAAMEYVGVYVNADSVERYITADEHGLHAQRQGGGVRDLDHLGNDRFIYNNDVVTISFLRTDGQVSGAHFRSGGVDETLTRSAKAAPTHMEVKPDPAVLQKYVGAFQLSIGMILTFRADGDRLFGQASGQPEFELFGEGPHTFFLKVVDATVEFHPEPDGTVDRMTLFQGGAIEGSRVK